jgi:hypothetical protein
MPNVERIDLYKLNKAEYVAPRQPMLLDIQPARYLSITGTGRPGGEEFQVKIGALYGMAFTLKFESKFAGRDYAVCKLEGLYWTDQGGCDFTALPSQQWHWDLIIRVPDFVDAARLKAARAKLEAKQVPHTAEVVFKTLREGRCVQMLHVGPYDREPETIEKMRTRASREGFEFAGTHHEIYLSDPRRVAPEKLRTILRIPVRKAKKA